MELAAVKTYCLGLPGVTEDIKWEHDLCYLVGGKMFAVVGLSDDPVSISFKTTPDLFEALITQEGIDPAPYVGRFKWVRLNHLTALDSATLQRYLAASYELIFTRLPSKTKKAIEGS